MKPKRLLAAMAMAALAFTANAQEDITGTWAGVINVTPEVELNIHFIVSEAPDGYSTVVTSPDPGGIQNVDASSTSFDGSTLSVNVEELSGSYEGSYADGAFEGQWTQQGSSFPLRLAPYEEPVLSQEVMDTLSGSWVGDLETPVGNLPVVYRFETNEEGEFEGFFDSPEEGAFGLPVSRIELEDGKFLLAVQIQQRVIQFDGDFTGDSMSGTFRPGGPLDLPLTVTRGTYEAPSNAIEMAPEQMSRIEGSWVGEIDTPNATLPIVVRFFEDSDTGEFLGMLDSPSQGASDIPIAEAAFEGDTLTFRVTRINASFSGTYSDEGIAGTFTQANMPRPLTLTRGSYEVEAVALELTADQLELIAGTWRGMVGGEVEVIIRFETDSNGNAVGFVAAPTQGVEGLPVTSVSIENEQLTLRIATIGVEFTAAVSEGELDGQWVQGTNPSRATTFTRE